MADRDEDYYDYALDPETWPPFMRVGLTPVPPSGQMWPDAAATTAPVNAPMPAGLLWPMMPAPTQQALDSLFMQSGMMPAPPTPFSTPFSSGASASAEDSPPIDEAAAAQDARLNWARRNGQWGRRGTQEYVSPENEVAAPAPEPRKVWTAKELQPQYAEQAEAVAAILNRRPDDLVHRDTVLPFGETRDGRVVLAVPDMLARPLHTLLSPIPEYGSDREAMVEHVLPLAELAMGGGMPFAKRGAAGVFGGRLGPGADQVALARAEEMARRGASREEILAETSWFKDGAGNWQYEISDHNARFVGPYGEQPARDLDRVIKHDDLFEAYPDLAQVQTGTNVRKGQPAGGYYETGPTGEHIDITAPGRREAISATLHEIQHAMNRREGFPTGVDPVATLSPEALAELTGKQRTRDDLWSQADLPANAGWRDGLSRSPTGEISGQPTSQMGQVMLQLQQRIDQLLGDAYEGYRMQPSEIMARNVQTRRTMTPLERLRYPPWETEGK